MGCPLSAACVLIEPQISYSLLIMQIMCNTDIGFSDCKLYKYHTLWFIKRGSTFVIITLDCNFTYLETGMNALCKYSHLHNYFTCDVNMTSLSRSWHWWAATASAACAASIGAIADWWRSWPMANTLACLCLYKWWTFWTYLVTVNLFFSVGLLVEHYVSNHAWCSG